MILKFVGKAIAVVTGNVGAIAKYFIIDRVEECRKFAADLATRVGDLHEKIPSVQDYHAFEGHLGKPQDTLQIVGFVLTIEKALVHAIESSTAKLIREFHGGLREKVIDFLVPGPRETQTGLRKKLLFKWLMLGSRIDDDADAFRRWADLDTVWTYLQAEENTLFLKEAHLDNIALGPHPEVMRNFILAAAMTVEAYDAHFWRSEEWIAGVHGDNSSAVKLINGYVEYVRGWLELKRTEDFDVVAQRQLVLPTKPIERPALNAAENRVDDDAGRSENQQLGVHLGHAKRTLKIENREADAARAYDHLDGHGQDQCYGEARTEPRHDVRQSRGEDDPDQSAAPPETQQPRGLEIRTVDRGGPLNRCDENGPERSEGDDEDVKSRTDS